MPSTPEGRALVEKYVKEGWIGVGGEKRLKDWNLCKKSYNLTDEDLPPHTGWCECDEEIMHNYWIFNKKTREIKVVGNVCVDKFTDGKRRVCDECGEPHRNRVINKCNDCRVGWCNCGASIDPYYKKCYHCYMNK